MGYWKFDENTGTTTADSSGNGNTGTLQSGASWASGHNNSAVSLDGVNDYVKIKDGKISTATSGTISGWVKLNSLANAVKIVGYGGGSAASVQATFDLEIRQDGSNYYFSIVGMPGSYTYNADGQRVRRKINGVETWQVYGFDGELIAEYAANVSAASPQKEYGYRNGQLLVTAEPFVNAAWNKPATQTDNLNATSTAAKAVNGDVDGTLAAGSVAASNSHANSWWQVDLQSVQTIHNITVWGRTDCCADMSSNFYVFVSDNPFTSYDLNTTINQSGVYNYLHSGYAGPGSIPVNRTGRYVRVQLAGTQSLALAEVQVWSAAAKLNWLVADQLGTPRLIFDKTGTLANVKRHDYLPFGEELFAGTGGRTTALGYSADNVRQKFTQKERDNETGLDYFLARYYSSTQGRFTSADKPFVDQHEGDPQSWSLYAYVGNNPLRYTDPFGLWKQVDCTTGKCWESDRKDDTYESLGKLIGVSGEGLAAFFQNEPITMGHTFDASGAGRWELDQTIQRFSSDERYMFIPGGGGLRTIGRGGASLISKATSSIGRWLGFGKKGSRAAAEVIEGGATVGRLPVPPAPYGISLRMFGQIMRWGTGSGEARARMASLTRAELESQGISREIAEAWRDFYRNEMRRVPDNRTAPGRADLMQRAVELLKDN